MDISEENTHSGFSKVKKGETTYYLRTGLSDRFKSAPESLFSAPAVGTVSGRREHKIVSAGGEKFVLRHYEHGGLLRFLTRDFYFIARRFLHELLTSQYALSRGIQTPEVAALRIRRSLFAYKADILTRFVEESADLQKIIRENFQAVGLARKREVIDKCAILIRRMHDCGILHADLHIKNILLSRRDGLLQPFLLDLDKAKILKALTPRQRMRNLFRLGRSLDKMGDACIITEQDKYRFFLGYLKAGEPLPIRKRAVVSQFVRHRKIHSIWRKLTVCPICGRQVK